MSARGLLVGWIVIPLLLLAALVWEVSHWRSLGERAARAEAEGARLAAELESKKQQVVQELRGRADLLKEMRWSPDRADASTFLRGLADVAHGEQLRVLSIGPLERESTAGYRKSWHAVGVSGRYRELKDLAARIEAEGAVLDEMVVEVPKEAPATDGRPPDELQARFKLTAMELSEQARAMLERALAVGAVAAPAPTTTATAGLALPVPRPRATSPAGLRDPFAFVAPRPPKPVLASAVARPPAAAAAAAPVADGAGTVAAAAPPPPPPPEKPMKVSGIVEFPGGALAIVNQEIVKVGDVVDGHRVADITRGQIVLQQPDGGRRTVRLAAFAPAERNGRRDERR